MISISQILNWYSQHFESRLTSRYICLNHINSILSEFKNNGQLNVVGTSENGLDILLIKIGNGPKKALAWSQMHGNESTTTKAIFDFLKFLSQNKDFKNEIKAFKNQWTFYIIPILNPDGAQLYTRENSNNIDLNRDAKNLSQSESMTLRSVFEDIAPDFCFNLHDQRTIYSLPGKKPATISFLAPSADSKRTITAARRQAMLSIIKMNNVLQDLIPGQIGRYDDTFNDNCVGDTFQALNVPTILFEAGHYPDDYQREKTRELIFYAFLSFFDFLNPNSEELTVDDYFKIPENTTNFSDIILRNVRLKDVLVDIIIQYEEVLQNQEVVFIPVIDKIEENSTKIGHKEIEIRGEEILLNSHENVFVNEKISTISFKKIKKPIIL